MSALTQLTPGAIFARDFKVIRPLRAGGMGAVYVVEQLSTGKQRALKLLIPELVGNPEIRERFEREAKVAANIESEHVVETVTAGVDEESGAPYLVMELLRGEELSDAIARTGPLPIADVAEILAQVGHALEQAHKQGLVHRDLKPENIFLCASKRRDGGFTAKILDFGIAKLVEDGMNKTSTRPLGSPLFMAPEQTDRKGKICPGTDVWALGLITFQLLTGASFWLGATGDSLPQLLREVVVDELPSASARAAALGVADELPEGFDAWFARCVHRDVDARFAEAGEATRAFAELVPKDATTRVLEVKTSSVESAMQQMKEDVASMATQIADESGDLEQAAAIVVAPAGGAVVDGGAATAFLKNTDDTGALEAARETKPAAAARPNRVLPIVALSLVASAGVAFFAVRRGPVVDPAPTPLLAVSSVSASAQAAAVVSSARTAVTPSDPRCPAGMIYQPGGTTILGAKDVPDSSADSRVTHSVTLSPYCLDRTEVTVRAYEECVVTGKCERTPNDVSYQGVTDAARKAYTQFCNARRADRLDHPINCVDWSMAEAYCAFRDARLPTEAEWEMAARGVQQHDFPWGDAPPDAKHLNAAGSEYAAWSDGVGMKAQTMFGGDDGFVGTAPVGSFPEGASQTGVMDLAGNVWEWTADWYGPYSPDAVTDPKGPTTGTERVVRGGAFNGSMIDWAKPAYRWKSLPATYNHGIGFRCGADAKRP